MILKKLIKEINNHSASGAVVQIPPNYKYADFDNDGIIHSNEAFEALDKFFDGELDITIEQLYGMIDFFFEQ